MHGQASCEFCGENSAAVSLPDKWGDLTRADPVLTPEEVSLGTEPRRELHIGWRGFEHTKRHSPVAIFRHQLGLHLPSCVTETHVGLPKLGSHVCHITRSQEVGSPGMMSRNSQRTSEHPSFLLCHPSVRLFLPVMSQLLQSHSSPHSRQEEGGGG